MSADRAASQNSPVETLAGLGIHGGGPCRVEFRLRTGGMPGPRFRFGNRSGWLTGADLSRLPRRARRSTILGLPLPGAAGSSGTRDSAAAPDAALPRSARSLPAAGGPPEQPLPGYSAGDGPGAVTVAVTEHLLASLLFFADRPLDVESDAVELPGLDGSALPYRAALARLCPAAAAAPAWREYPCDLVWEDRWAGGWLRIRPAERFSAVCELERGPLRQSFAVSDAAAAWREILPARSFAFHSEWLAASAEGMMAGAGPGSGLLLAADEAEYRALREHDHTWNGRRFPLLHPEDFRMPDEPVKHKLLDLLGDLALADLALPRAHIEIRNGGHAAHHRLLARLAERRRNAPMQ